MTQKDTHAMLANEMTDINKVLDGGVTEKEIEYNTRNQVLIHYNIIDAELNLLFKGKVASKANNLILTEFFFSGLISSLNDCELLALLSIFNIREKAGRQVPDCSKVYSSAFSEAVSFIEKETEKLLVIEEEKGIVE
jgi:superfamily II RNA helicase